METLEAVFATSEADHITTHPFIARTARCVRSAIAGAGARP